MPEFNNLIWGVFFLLFLAILIWLTVVVLLVVRARLGRRKRESALLAVDEMEQLGRNVPISLHRDTKPVLRRAVVFVFGDFARSPRMQYHAASLAKCGMFDEIILLGFNMGNKLIDELQNANDKTGSASSNVNTRYLINSVLPPAWFAFVFRGRNCYWLVSKLYTVVIYLALLLLLFLRLSLTVVNKTGQLVRTDIFIFQLPPAIPFVPIFAYIIRPCVCILNALNYYCILFPAACFAWDDMKDIYNGIKLQKQTAVNGCSCGTKLCSAMCPALLVDWHNFGHTIMQSERRPFFAIWLYRLFECSFCFGDRNITVSMAMRNSIIKYRRRRFGQDSEREQLTSNDVVVLYDGPPSFFGPVSRSHFVRDALLPAMKDSFTALGEVIGLSPPPVWIMQADNDTFNGSSVAQEGLFVVAATSWTPDDDYSVVIDALVSIDKRLQEYQKSGQSGERVKNIWLLVTGKGTTRGDFERAVMNANLSSLVTVTTIYFQQYKHYAMALGAADVGLCVHHSSSGLDLPMKAVDMLSSGLPVVALYTEAIDELLDDNNGWLFKNSKDLESIFWDHLLNISKHDSEATGSLKQKRLYVKENPRQKWDDKWKSVVLPILRDLV